MFNFDLVHLADFIAHCALIAITPQTSRASSSRSKRRTNLIFEETEHMFDTLDEDFHFDLQEDCGI
jgi:hypothetical protein